MNGHLPVMLHEVLATLAPRDAATYLDATFGGGGYSAAILDSAPRCTLFAMDRDPDAIARGADLVARYAPRLHLIEGRFGFASRLIPEKERDYGGEYDHLARVAEWSSAEEGEESDDA